MTLNSFTRCAGFQLPGAFNRRLGVFTMKIIKTLLSIFCGVMAALFLLIAIPIAGIAAVLLSFAAFFIIIALPEDF